MFKRIAAFLCAAALLIPLAACSGKSKPDSDVVGKWKVDLDDVTYYYDFENDGELTVYVDSYTLEMKYDTEQKDGYATVEIKLPSSEFGTIGVLYPDTAGEFTVKEGTYDKGDRVAELRYPDEDEEDQSSFTFTEVEKVEPAGTEPPEDFKIDEKLLDTWVNNYSTDEARQKIVFEKDGTMQIVEDYTNADKVTLTISRSCAYSATDGKCIMTYAMGEETSLPVDYTVEDDSLNFGGMYFTREGVEIPESAKIEMFDTDETETATESESVAATE